MFRSGRCEPENRESERERTQNTGRLCPRSASSREKRKVQHHKPQKQSLTARGPPPPPPSVSGGRTVALASGVTDDEAPWWFPIKAFLLDLLPLGSYPQGLSAPHVSLSSLHKSRWSVSPEK